MTYLRAAKLVGGSKRKNDYIEEGCSYGYVYVGREAARVGGLDFEMKFWSVPRGFEMKFRDVPYPDEKRKCSLTELNAETITMTMKY